MSASTLHSTAERRVPTVRWVGLPKAQFSPIVVGAIGIGGQILILIGAVPLVGRLGPTQGVLLAVVAWGLVMIVAVLAAIRFYGIRVRRRVDQFLVLRRSRLDKVCGHERAVSHVPHRLVERVILDNLGATRKSNSECVRKSTHALQPVLSRLPKGLVVVVGQRGQCALRKPFLLEMPFEPVDAADFEALRDFREQVVGLLGDAPLTGLGIPSGNGAWIGSLLERANRTRKIWRIRLTAAMGIGTALCAVIGVMVWAVTSRRTGVVFVSLACSPLLALLPLVIKAVTLNEHAYIVPGGFISTRHPAWRRRGRAWYARRRDTVMVHDSRFTAIVCMNGQSKRVPFSSLNLVAWLATAPSPSVEEVQALVGDDVDLTVAS